MLGDIAQANYRARKHIEHYGAVEPSGASPNLIDAADVSEIRCCRIELPV